DALESEPTRVGPPRRRRDTIVSAEETASDAPAAPEPEPSAAAAVDAGPSGAVPADAARPELGAPELGAPELGAPELGAPEPAQSVSAESATAAVGPSDEAGEGAPFELRRSDPGRPSSDVVERTTPGSLPSPEPRPSVVVARVVAI